MGVVWRANIHVRVWLDQFELDIIHSVILCFLWPSDTLNEALKVRTLSTAWH